MTAHDIFVLLLGIVSSVTLVISALSVHRFRLIAFGTATGVLVGIQYGLVGAMVGLVVVAIGLARNITMLLSYKYPWLNDWKMIPVFMVLHTIAFMTLSDWDHMVWQSFIPLIGGYAGTIAIFFRNLIYTKSILIVMGGLWLFYQFDTAIYGQMVGEGLTVVANSAALVTLILAKFRGIPVRELIDVDTQIIETITSSIPVIREHAILTSEIHLPVHRQRPPLVDGAHPTSVGYSRLLTEHKSR